MHSRLTELLQRLPSSELSRIDKFVKSPYFNTHEQINCLWSFYKKHHPEFADNKFNDEKAYQHLFGRKQAFDRRKLNRLNSELYKLLEQYICVRELESDQYVEDDLLIRFFEREGLSEHSLSLHQRLEKKLKDHLEGEELYSRRLALEKSLWAHLVKKDKRTGDVNLEPYNEALDIHFLVQKLKILALMLNRGQVVNINYELSDVDDIISLASKEQFRNNLTIKVYLCILRLQLQPNEKGFYFELKQLLESSGKAFNQDELRTFFAYLTNSIKYHFNTESYGKEHFSLYKKQLDLNLLHYEQKLPHSTYRNVVFAALESGALKWAEGFIESNKYCIIPKDYQQEAYRLNLASLRYYQGKLDEAQLILAQLNPIDIYYKLLQRSLQCRLFYEQKELLFLSKFLGSFSKYVHDQQEKIADAKIASYRHFINYLNALIKVIMESEKAWSAFDQNQPIKDADTVEKLGELQTRIEAESLFYNKKWLLDRIKKSL